MNMINTRLVTATAVTAGSAIPVGTVIHRSGSAISAGGNTIQINGSGFYKITANATISASAEGNQTVSMNSNGTAIATATATADTAGGDVNLTTVGVVYNRCGCNTASIGFTAGVAGEVTEMDVVVERM